MSIYYSKSCDSIKPCDNKVKEETIGFLENPIVCEDDENNNPSKWPRPVILIDEISIGGNSEFRVLTPQSMRLLSEGILLEPKDTSELAGHLWAIPINQENSILTFRVGKHVVDYPVKSISHTSNII